MTTQPDSGSILPYIPQRNFDNATLAERIYQNLREDILSNRLLPGTPLQEASIAAALEVSRAPVREAFRKLEAEGLITVFPRRGAEVSSLSRKEFLDAYRVRQSLEVLAIQLAAPRLTPTDLKELQRLHQEMVERTVQGDIDGFFKANRAFHDLFVDRSDNLKLQEIYFPLIDQMGRYRLPSVTLRGGMERSVEEHYAILQALRKGDAEEAARLLKEHIAVPQRALEVDDKLEVVLRSDGARNLPGDSFS